MNQKIEKIEKERLKFVLAFYETNIIYHHFIPSRDCLEVGEQLSEQTLRDIFNFVNQEKINLSKYFFKDFAKYHVLKFSDTQKKIIWITEPKIEKMLFKKEHPMKSGNYPMPKLLWSLSNETLKVFALNRNDKISEETKIYTAPFLNVDHKGQVCMGNATFKNELNDYNQIIENVHYNFFNSIFTHTNYDKLLKVNYIDYCKDFYRKKDFPDNYLIKKSLTLKDIL